MTIISMQEFWENTIAKGDSHFLLLFFQVIHAFSGVFTFSNVLKRKLLAGKLNLSWYSNYFTNESREVLVTVKWYGISNS